MEPMSNVIRNRIRQQAEHGARLSQFIKFCLVGASRVVVNSTEVYFLAIGWNPNLSKACSVEAHGFGVCKGDRRMGPGVIDD
jgi:hypothetical protein